MEVDGGVRRDTWTFRVPSVHPWCSHLSQTEDRNPPVSVSTGVGRAPYSLTVAVDLLLSSVFRTLVVNLPVVLVPPRTESKYLNRDVEVFTALDFWIKTEGRD